MPTGLRGYDMEEAHHRREYATVAAAVGGGKPIGERQFGVAVPGGVEHVGLRARMLHETGNWLVLTDCSNAFSIVKRTPVLEDVVNCVPTLTPSVAKCYRTRPADLSFRMDSGETRTIACSSGVQVGDPMEPAMFCLALQPGLKRFRQESEREGVKAFAYMDDRPLGLTGITANTVRHSPSFGES